MARTGTVPRKVKGDQFVVEKSYVVFIRVPVAHLPAMLAVWGGRYFSSSHKDSSSPNIAPSPYRRLDI